MSDSDQIYQPPKPIATSFMPKEIFDFLNGNDLDRKLSEAVRISTVSEDGWPHAAMLSAGEMLALDASEIAMLLYDGSKTSRNLARDGRLTLTIPLGHGLCEIRLRATAKKQEGRHRCFTALVEDVRQHRSNYADVVSGVTFRLHDPTAVLARWSRQIEMLRGLK
jgi:Pyridoxamine 5'-phosphate oxidase